MSAKPVELVVFDLGRVMIRLVGNWPDACAKSGVAYSKVVEDPQVKHALTRLFIRNEVGELDHDQWTTQVGKIIDRTPAEVSAILHAWLDGPFPGWDPLLDELHDKGYKTACLSNTNAVHWDTMLSSDGPNRLPLDRLHYRFASHLIRAHKPDPKIYEYVEIETGVAPSRIFFFDDLKPNVEGARARGWQAELIVPEEEPVAQVRRALRL